MQIIPVINVDSQAFTTVLDDQRVRFFINYQVNPETGVGSWFTDIELLTSSIVADSIIVLGNRLTTFQSPTLNYLSSLPGDVYVIPTSVPYTDLTQEQPWGKTHELVYYTLDEIESIRQRVSEALLITTN